MLKKTITLLIIITAIINLSGNKAYSLASVPLDTDEVKVSSTENTVNSAEADIIKRVSFRDKLKKTPETQINTFFKKFAKYSQKNNIEKLKEMYSDDYINNDGFNKKAVFKMMEMSGNSYKNVKYDINVLNVSISGNYAVATLKEIATGETTKSIEKFSGPGIVNSEIVYTDYLKKDGADWKITNTDILTEKVELKYGEAKQSQIDLYAPECVSEGSEYEVTMTAQTPDGVFVVGSLSNEPIVLPQVINKEVFRSLKNETLARVLKANTDGNNEYATASLAITRAQVEPDSVVINMTGMAFVMKRVNVTALNKNVAIKEEDSNAATTKTTNKKTTKKRSN